MTKFIHKIIIFPIYLSIYLSAGEVKSGLTICENSIPSNGRCPEGCQKCNDNFCRQDCSAVLDCICDNVCKEGEYFEDNTSDECKNCYICKACPEGYNFSDFLGKGKNSCYTISYLECTIQNGKAKKRCRKYYNKTTYEKCEDCLLSSCNSGYYVYNSSCAKCPDDYPLSENNNQYGIESCYKNEEREGVFYYGESPNIKKKGDIPNGKCTYLIQKCIVSKIDDTITDKICGYEGPSGGEPYCIKGTLKCNEGYYGEESREYYKKEFVKTAKCETCPAGSYCEGEKTQPKTCPAGNYCPQGAPNPIPCKAGTYQNETGKLECKPCPKGFECPEDGMKCPKACGRGKYQCYIQQTSCISCADNQYDNWDELGDPIYDENTKQCQYTYKGSKATVILENNPKDGAIWVNITEDNYIKQLVKELFNIEKNKINVSATNIYEQTISNINYSESIKVNVIIRKDSGNCKPCPAREKIGDKYPKITVDYSDNQVACVYSQSEEYTDSTGTFKIIGDDCKLDLNGYYEKIDKN